MRFPIGAKIYLMTMVLLLAMTAIAVSSYQRIKLVTRQVDSLADYHLPITSLFRGIDNDLQAQITSLAKLRQAQNPLLEGPLVEELKTLYRVNVDISKDLNEANRYIDEAMAKVREDENIRDLSSLFAQTKLLARENSAINQAFDGLVGGVENRDPQQIDNDLAALLKDLERTREILAAAGQELYTMTLTAASDAKHQQETVFRHNLIITILASCFGLIAALLLTLGIVRPLLSLGRETRKVAEGNIEVEVAVTTHDEVADLTRTFNTMTSQLRLKERITRTFGRFIDPRIVSTLLAEPEGCEGRGQKQLMTVLFCDLQGFTSLSERFTPTTMVRLLNSYLAAMSRPVQGNNGVIDKFIGDAVMAFWGPPFVERHAEAACRAALQQHHHFIDFERELSDVLGLRRDLPHVALRVGVATGQVLAGSIGSESARAYTVIGNSVNLASRLEHINRFYGTKILVNHAARELAGETLFFREIDSVRVLGKEEPEHIFELLALTEEASETVHQLKAEYEAGLAAYRDQDWQRASEHLRGCLRHRPNDGPATTLLARIADFAETPPPAHWDGVWDFMEK